MEVDIIIPSKGGGHHLRCLESLKHIPFPYTLYFITEGKSWSKAVNIGFFSSSRDVILMDDDVIILPDTFNDFERYYPHADIFGFKLIFENGKVQHGGGKIGPRSLNHRRERDGIDTPAYLCHVTTSLCFIKRRVINSQVMDECYSGYQFEDVDFNFRATDNGFKILYLPLTAIHLESATKKNDPEYKNKAAINFQRLCSKFGDFSAYGKVQPFQLD